MNQHPKRPKVKIRAIKTASAAKPKPASKKPPKTQPKPKRIPEAEVAITTPFIKLDSLLKLAGIVFTGGEAKEMVLAGIVEVDGETCLERGRKIRPGQRVVVDRHQALLVTAGTEE